VSSLIEALQFSFTHIRDQDDLLQEYLPVCGARRRRVHTAHLSISIKAQFFGDLLQGVSWCVLCIPSWRGIRDGGRDEGRALWEERREVDVR
jgi:hypothetical protein